MSHKTRVVTSTACPVDVTRPVVTVSCPTTLPTTTVTPAPITTTVPTDALTALAQQLGLAPGALAGLTGQVAGLGQSSPQQVFNNPLTQLGGLSPFAALAASNPSAALAALSPTLGIFNPAINPAAAFLQFNPAAAPTLALAGKGFGKSPFGKSPFGKFPFGI